MHSLVVLSDQSRWRSYFPIVFPLYKWKSLLKTHGINVIITNDRNDKRLKNADTVILISRVFSEWQNIQKRTPENEAALFNYLIDIKKSVKKLVWYDTSDPTGTTDFPVIPYVDSFLKNQIFKDIQLYTQNNGATSIRHWLTETTHLEDHFKKYYPCPPNELHKIQLGWNIMLTDHRLFKGKTKIISNYIFSSPKIYPPSLDRKLGFSFRGGIDHGNKNSSISMQRNKVITILNQITKYKSIVSSERVDKSTFIKELSESKIGVSPFGWGEICYRDFEVFIAGGVMVKPSVSYLKTYPDVFIENETYIPISWEMDELKNKLEDIIDNYPNYLHIAKNGQNAFLNGITNGEEFAEHIKKIIA